jgi:dienelactone hydrolase
MSRLRVVLLFLLGVLPAAAQTAPAYETVYFPSGKLKIEGYVYRPAGDGPFPAVIYNHGSRAGFDREERPMAFVGQALVPAGYVVFVVERRGYGKSDGATMTDEVGGERGMRYVSRLSEEAEDVLAATDYLKQQPYVDRERVGIMGWSLGGIMTVLATSRRSDYCAAIDQAAGALSWNGSPELRAKLKDAAGKIHVPLLSMVAENDATTDAMKAIDHALPKKTPHQAKVYPAFHPRQPSPRVADGHMVFSREGVEVWKADVLAWLEQCRAPAGRK